MKHLIFALALAPVLVPAIGSAQSLGAAEFTNSCAACHGMDGKGGGPMAGYLTGTLPDLTQLSADNGGLFPVTKVYSIIDGTMGTGAHGTREMPVWGNRYMREGVAGANPDFQANEAEVFARFRILSLTEYIASIQE